MLIVLDKQVLVFQIPKQLDNVPHLVVRPLLTVVADRVASSWNVIYVNDGSPDNSLDVVNKLQESDARIEVVNLSRNFGHHHALMTGVERATGDFTFVIDVDLEEPPELLESFAAEM